MDRVFEIMKVMDFIEYGFKDEKGINLVNTDRWDKFYEFYYLLKPDELLEKKCGVCWDQVELERKLFLEKEINCDTYFIYIDDKENLPSHTFLTFSMNDKFYWFEHSWYSNKGILEYNSIKKLLMDVKEKFIESRKDEVDNILDLDVYIYKYERPSFHITCDEFYDYIKTQELIKL